MTMQLLFMKTWTYLIQNDSSQLHDLSLLCAIFCFFFIFLAPLVGIGLVWCLLSWKHWISRPHLP